MQMEITVPDHNQPISVIEKFCPSITVASCVILDESISKQLEVSLILDWIESRNAIILLHYCCKCYAFQS